MVSIYPKRLSEAQISIQLNRLAADQKTVAERKWNAPKLARRPQETCDFGLFSDDKDQSEMF